MIDVGNAFKGGICTRGDLGIWAYQEKLLQKFHQRAFTRQVSAFLLTVTKVNGVQTGMTSPHLSKVGNSLQMRLLCL